MAVSHLQQTQKGYVIGSLFQLVALIIEVLVTKREIKLQLLCFITRHSRVP
jgi:hypothetical protein